MKPSLTKTIMILFILPLFSCSTLSDPNSPTVKLGTQVLAVAISQVTGHNVTAADLDGAAAVVRSLAGKKTPPASVEIKAAVQVGTDKPSKAATLASKVADYVTNAIVKGMSHDKAIETAAASLNQAAEVKR